MSYADSVREHNPVSFEEPANKTADDSAINISINKSTDDIEPQEPRIGKVEEAGEYGKFEEGKIIASSDDPMMIGAEPVPSLRRNKSLASSFMKASEAYTQSRMNISSVLSDCCQQVDALNTRSDEHHRQLQELKTELDESTGKLNNSISELESDLNDRLDEQKTQLEKETDRAEEARLQLEQSFNSKLSDHVSDTKNSLDALRCQMEAETKDTRQKITEVESALQEQLRDQSSEINKKIDEVESGIEESHKSLQGEFKEHVGVINTSMRTESERIESQLKQHDQELARQNQAIEVTLEEIGNIKSQHTTLLQDTEQKLVSQIDATKQGVARDLAKLKKDLNQNKLSAERVEKELKSSHAALNTTVTKNLKEVKSLLNEQDAATDGKLTVVRGEIESGLEQQEKKYKELNKSLQKLIAKQQQDQANLTRDLSAKEKGLRAERHQSERIFAFILMILFALLAGLYSDMFGLLPK